MAASAVEQRAPVAAHVSPARCAAVLGAMMVSMLGIDLLFNAGLLARFYFHPGAALLPSRQLMLRIPFGYASFLLSLGLFLWIEVKVGIRTARGGAQFGAIWGSVSGVAYGLGLFSLVPLGADFLAGVAVCIVVEYVVAGAIGGAGAGGSRLGRLYGIAVAMLIVSLAAVIAMQAAGIAAVEHR